MEEIMQLIVRACEKSRDLQENLPGIAAQVNLLSAKCEAIAADFGEAVTRLSLMRSLNRVDPSSGQLSPPLGMPATTGASSAQRSTRKSNRKDGCQTWTIRVPAVAGNPDALPDDGYTWRKYGQKNILQSKFPRSYYRCTHKNFYGCEAKKHVQRLDDDPLMYEVTYSREHSCRTSPTPYPIMNEAAAAGMDVVPLTQAQYPSVVSTFAQAGSNWFSMNIGFKNDDTWHAAETSGAANWNLSHLPAGRDLDCSAAELADVMFSSRGNGGYLMM